MQWRTVPIAEHFFRPKNVGEAAKPNFVGRSASLSCGATVQISLHIDESQRIAEAKFKAAGCSALVASASLLTECIPGKTTGEAADLGQHEQWISEQLGIVEAERNECSALVCEALISAIGNYSDFVREAWEGDEALICTCFCVSERTIERAIQEKGLTSIAEVTRACKAGAGCRSCYSLIEDILDDCKRGQW